MLLAVIGLTGPLFVWPDNDAPVRADAVVVLGGVGAKTDQAAAELVRQGDAPVLVVSAYQGERCPPHVDGIEERCFVANPFSTRGEARSIAALARQLHWRRILVVVPTPQATRARLRIERCYHGQLLVHGVSPDGIGQWLGRIAYEWGALLKAVVLQPDC